MASLPGVLPGGGEGGGLEEVGGVAPPVHTGEAGQSLHRALEGQEAALGHLVSLLHTGQLHGQV